MTRRRALPMSQARRPCRLLFARMIRISMRANPAAGRIHPGIQVINNSGGAQPRPARHVLSVCLSLAMLPAAAQVPPPSATTLDTLVVTADVLDRDDSRPGTVSTATP